MPAADFLADLFIVLCLGLAIGGSLSFLFELARARAMRRPEGPHGY